MIYATVICGGTIVELEQHGVNPFDLFALVGKLCAFGVEKSLNKLFGLDLFEPSLLT